MSRLLVLAVLLTAGCATPRPATSPAAAAEAPRPFRVEVSGHGPPVVLIPGLGSSGEVWEATVARYRERHECHVLTLAGFAGEPAVEGANLAAVRDALARYLRERHLERPVLVGHSLGGVIALALAAEEPSLVGAVVVVDSLPFLSAGYDPAATPESARPQAAQLRTQLSLLPLEQRRQMNLVTARRMVSDEALAQRVAGWTSRSSPEALGTFMYDVLTTDLRPQLARIQAPVHVLGAALGWPGRTPEAVTALYEGQYAAAPRHRVAVHPRARHFLMYEDPRWFFAELDAVLASPVAAAAR